MKNIKKIESYINFILEYDLPSIDVEIDRIRLRLGAMYLDRVRIAYKTKLEYNGRAAIPLVEALELKSLDEVDDKIDYLLATIKALTDREHPLLCLMFFGGDGIESKISKKFKYQD